VTPWRRFADVYRYYTAQRFSDRLFVKIDDDVVFVETNQFAAFVAAATGNRRSVTSATVINNAACTAVDPELNAAVSNLGVPLQGRGVQLRPGRANAWSRCSHHLRPGAGATVD